MKTEKTKGKIYIGGSLCFGGPDIAARLKGGEEVLFENDHCVEMRLSVEPRLQDQVLRLDPWFALDYAEVDIKSEADFEVPDLCITFSDGNNGELGLRINFEQAMVIKDILTYFVNGCDAAECLRRVQHAEVPDEKIEERESSALRS